MSALDVIFKIQSRVSPPNPLFGPLWENLKNYLIQRNADQLSITENAGPREALQSVLPELAANYTETTRYPNSELFSPIPVGDAAILMAVDGYGVGTIRGRIGRDVVVIKKSETIANFSFDKDPLPENLYFAANEQFEKITVDRYMEHG